MHKIMGMRLCENCVYNNKHRNCWMDVYQRLGRTKGTSVVIEVLLAFVTPIIVFIGGLVLSEYFLFASMSESGLKTFLTFLTALIITILTVQLIRIFTRKPDNKEIKHVYSRLKGSDNGVHN